MDNTNKQFSLEAAIEAILFYTAEPMSFKKLSNLTKTSIDEVRAAADELKNRLDNNGGGTRLLVQNNEIVLGTTPEVSELIEQITRDEISKELSKAALETLSIICYKGPLTRSEVDYVRGVNSTFIIRNLLIRGIVEKLENPRDSRASLYGPTFAAFEYMGVTRKEDLPKYEEVQAQLEAFLAEKTVDDSVDEKKQEEEPETAYDEEIISEDEAIENNIEADISEENIMNPEFDDSEIKEHLESDETGSFE